MSKRKTILVTGATGKQGGAVLRHLKGSGFELRALTRKPESEAARALVADGAHVVEGDLDDVTSLKTALTDVWGVFAVQNTWEAGVEREEEQGKRLARLAREAGVQHFVYSSVGSAERATGVPHFDNKWRVEEEVRALGFPSHVILRPVFFMENLPSPWFLNGDALGTAMKPDTKLQMVAVDDIGRVGARAFTDAAKLNGREIEIGGDEVTMARAAAVLGKSLARDIQFVEYPITAVREQSEDMALMLEWFERVGYGADIAALDAEFGPMTRLDTWAAKTLSA
ncbi:MAG: NmrA/HSCARG family protein [Deltaproteobacteria bacterium]|nr:NmrA/HSCARG family protein [Deltaproteobacteria bacterium]